MAFQTIFTFLLFLGCGWGIWKILISPRIPDEPEIPEYERILKDKLEKLQFMRAEYEAVKTEKEATKELEKLDKEIDKVIRQIKEIEK